MKRTFLAVFVSISLLFSKSYSQISEGGKPLTMQLFGVNNLDSALNANPYTSSIGDLSKTQLRTIRTSQVELPAPDLTPIMKEDQVRNKKNGLFREGIEIPCDISPQSSGNWTTLYNGEKIWRLKIKVAGAKAIGLSYDHFYLPEGARYYIFNENGRHVLGAYTSNNNPEDDSWVTEKVQGELANLEIDLPADVDSSSVHMHINSVGDFYRATEYLNRYKTDADKIEYTLFPFGGSSPCEINAICQKEGSSMPDQRMATIKIEYRYDGGDYGISATLMNNTNQNCTPYLMTASHGDPTNSTNSSTFSKWIFYFNYETPTCSYDGVDSPVFYSQTMTGAYFKARSSYDSSSNIIYGDFLLLQLESSIPVSYNAYFSGWDNTGVTPNGTCISFHHPSGDVKKVSTTTDVSPYGSFNNGEKDSHWMLRWGQGGTEEGSSGSGLFEPGGQLIGDLSGGNPDTPKCLVLNSSGDTMATIALYSKFSLNWDYIYQQPSTPQSRLHDWLDPVEGGAATKLGPLANTQACISGISTPKAPQISVDVYPNPTQGTVFANIHLDKTSNLKIEVFNMMGLKVSEMDLPDVLSGKYILDLGNNPSGMYMVRISSNDASITEKIITVNK